MIDARALKLHPLEAALCLQGFKMESVIFLAAV